LFNGFKSTCLDLYEDYSGRFTSVAKLGIVEVMPEPSLETRSLSADEHQLIAWMLEHGNREAALLLPQLAVARATSWRCPCGCASFNLVVEGQPPIVTGQMRIVADFIFGPDDHPSGIFLFEKSGVLAGLEVYGLAGDAPKSLPISEVLRAF
jgi:hypothetical protein